MPSAGAFQSLDLQNSGSDARESTHAANIADYRQSLVDPLEQAELRARMEAAIEEVGEPGRSALGWFICKDCLTAMQPRYWMCRSEL